MTWSITTPVCAWSPSWDSAARQVPVPQDDPHQGLCPPCSAGHHGPSPRPRLFSCFLPCFPLTRFIFLRGPELPEPADVQLHPSWPLYLHLLPGLLQQQLPVWCVRLCLDQPGMGTAGRGTGQEWAKGCKGAVSVIGTAETGGWHVWRGHGAARREHLPVGLLDRAGTSSRIPRTGDVPAPD